MFKIKGHIVIAVLGAFFLSCANQQPPPGGDDDLAPPKISVISPKPNTLNFRSNRLVFEFDEYVDRRSFTDAFFISPSPQGGYEFEWSGKDAEVVFEKKFEPDRTYRVVIGRGLKDIRGNSIPAPVQFAFSTGSRIDKGAVSGIVYAGKYDRMSVFAYITDKPDSLLNPEKKSPDFSIPCDENGRFRFENLPRGNYRLFAVYDSDRNLLFDRDFDEISACTGDVEITEESEPKGCRFIMRGMFPDDDYFGSRDFFAKLSRDSAGFIHSSVSDNEKDVPVNSRFFFYFRNSRFSTDELLGGFTFEDSLGRQARYVKTWLNDSLLEIVPFGLLKYRFRYVFGFRLDGAVKYSGAINFFTAEEKKSGSISGRVLGLDSVRNPVLVRIFNTGKPYLYYNTRLNPDSLFSFQGLFDGSYGLFAFIDSDNDGDFSFGSYYPFQPGEVFYFYDGDLTLKGGWKIDDVIVRF